LAETEDLGKNSRKLQDQYGRTKGAKRRIFSKDLKGKDRNGLWRGRGMEDVGRARKHTRFSGFRKEVKKLKGK